MLGLQGCCHRQVQSGYRLVARSSTSHVQIRVVASQMLSAIAETCCHRLHSKAEGDGGLPGADAHHSHPFVLILSRHASPRRVRHQYTNLGRHA